MLLLELRCSSRSSYAAGMGSADGTTRVGGRRWDGTEICGGRQTGGGISGV